MKRIFAAALWLLLMMVAGSPTMAQNAASLPILATCGTATYTASSAGKPQLGYMTILPTGELCIYFAGGGAPPLPLPTAGITPYISPSLESCKSLKTTPGTVISYGVTTGATAGFLMIFDQSSATPPVDGAVTPAALAIQVPANATVTRTYSPPSTLKMLNGIMLCFSSTGPFTKTASATAMLEGTWQ